MVKRLPSKGDLCPMCGKRPIVYLGAHACGPECDAKLRSMVEEYTSRSACSPPDPPDDPVEDLDPFELP